MRKRLEDIEDELIAAGHRVERTYEAPEGSRKPLSDSKWVFRVDGVEVGRGGALGLLEDELARWMRDAWEPALRADLRAISLTDDVM